MSKTWKPLGEGYYQVSGLNSEGSWETLHGVGVKTLQEAEEVYQTSDPLKYSIVQLHRDEELIMTSDPTKETPLTETMVPTSEGKRLFSLRRQKGYKATGNPLNIKGGKKFEGPKINSKEVQDKIRRKRKKFD
jgi:hypothetical protein